MCLESYNVQSGFKGHRGLVEIAGSKKKFDFSSCFVKSSLGYTRGGISFISSDRSVCLKYTNCLLCSLMLMDQRQS